MKISIEERDGQCVLTLSGELDTAAAQELEKAIQPLYDCKDKDIIVDCAELEYIASSGLRVLLALLKKARENGGSVKLRNVGEVILEVFNLTGFDTLFEIC